MRGRTALRHADYLIEGGRRDVIVLGITEDGAVITGAMDAREEKPSDLSDTEFDLLYILCSREQRLSVDS